MKNSYVSKEVLNSWRRCLEMDLPSNASIPVSMKEYDIKVKLDENKMLLSVFKDAVEKVNTQILGKHSFLLTDSEGIILYINKKNHTILKEGISLAEEISGTNAISLSLKLNKKVNTEPQHHYCSFFSRMYLFSVPICIRNRIIGSIAVASTGIPIKKELIIITELLAYQVGNEVEGTGQTLAKRQISQMKFSDKQLMVLKLLAKGMTEKAVAIDSGISINTVRYHKKIIFRKLDTSNVIDAVVKALKYNLITIDEI
ncbi:LuxR C-terminal-related transcriptional regulator [Ruminiclostridium papyrosolvens]|uniref:LuxR family transcriptional regulator n=1 Tax=Ruminiclostridium papyrosolvens C7 TaxID=1330534 RepID=U4R0L7_9FIRM|nr:LuxR C-terminal-related transcriptional regulator [Ruminiclostridium papyrosolvens]EPR10303.1 LuxR family transcriptional regulator [Ruminiclostridium papyrosolvens C7]